MTIFYKANKKSTPLYMRASLSLDAILEEMARLERRTKTSILALSLEEHAERHHPELYRTYQEAMGYTKKESKC